MATKPKTKRMMMGGMSAPVGKALGAARSAATQAAPKQMQFMSDKLRGAPMQSKPYASPPPKSAPSNRPTFAGGEIGGPRKAPPPAYAKPYADKQAAANALRKLPMNPPRPGMAGPKPMTGLGDAMRGLGAGAAGVARGIAGSDLKRAGLMKKGGAVKKKATKK